LEFLDVLRSDPELRRSIVFVMTTSADEEDRFRAYDKHVAGYMLKHNPARTFLDAVSMGGSLLAGDRGSTAVTSPVLSVLLIDDDEIDRKAVVRAFRAVGRKYEIREARDGRGGLALARDEPFDCIILDYELPDMTGLDLLLELRETDGITIPVVILTGTGNESVAVEAMKRGAHDYLQKAQLGAVMLSGAVANAIDKHLLERKLLEAQQKLEHLALYDALTELGNRNLFHHELTRSIAIAKRQKSSFPLLMMDLDRFKIANDTYGHEAGDAILAAVGARLREISRAADMYFRLGGDEFVAILHTESDGRLAALRIIAAVGRPFPIGTDSVDIGISIGVANYPADGENAKDLVRAADTAMYAAKKSAFGWAAVAKSD
jgi:diguanylate cyclase (GGDEF)-like protein